MSQHHHDRILVSIVLPTYKRAHLLAQAMRSVLNQTRTKRELIVVDNDLFDDTAQGVASSDGLPGFSERPPTVMDCDLWLCMLARRLRCFRVPGVLAYCRDPECIAHLTQGRISEPLCDPLPHEVYRGHWRADTKSARRLLRCALHNSAWKADLKRLVASPVHAAPYNMLAEFITRHRIQ